MAAKSVDPNFFPGITGLNARVLQDVDVEAIEKKIIDGKAF